jgi:hypothetical protein
MAIKIKELLLVLWETILPREEMKEVEAIEETEVEVIKTEEGEHQTEVEVQIEEEEDQMIEVEACLAINIKAKIHTLVEMAKTEEAILTIPNLTTTNKAIHLIKASGTPKTSQERHSRVHPLIKTCLNTFKTKTH